MKYERLRAHLPTRGAEIFVFGSNLAGRHGAGSARCALLYHGAQYGVGIGRTGDSYAIPTKDERLETLPKIRIKIYVDKFIEYARQHPELKFRIVNIGCGLAGYSDKQMAPLFSGCPSNCHFTPLWSQILNRK